MSSAKEQTAARYVLIELLEAGMDLPTIAKITGIRKTELTSFYRAEAGSDLTPKEVDKLGKLHKLESMRKGMGV